MGLTLPRAATAAAAATIVAAAVVATAGGVSGNVRTQTVAVTLREYAIVMPETLRPGRTTFILRNRGRFPHNFTAIYGPVHFHSPTVAPGTSRRLTVRLIPGAYMVACTVLDGGHLAKGMFTLFTIGTRRHGSADWHYP